MARKVTSAVHPALPPMVGSCVACTPERLFDPFGPSISRAPLSWLLCEGHLVLVRAREVAEPHRRLGDLIASEIDQTATRLAADRPHDRIGRLIIIQRHRHTLYWTLTQGFERLAVAATLRVIRDRRCTDRRDPPQHLLPGFADRRRPGDRRLALPPSWAGLGVVVTSAARMDGPSPADSAHAKFGPM